MLDVPIGVAVTGSSGQVIEEVFSRSQREYITVKRLFVKAEFKEIEGFLSDELQVGEDFDFGGELERLGSVAVEHRLFAHTISGTEEAFTVPDGQCEHAVEAFETVRTPFKVGRQRDLSIRFGIEIPTESPQFIAEFGIVVYFTVEENYALADAYRQIDVMAVDDV